MLHGDADRDTLLNTGLGFDVVQPTSPAVDAQVPRPGPANATAAGASPLPTGRTEYRTFEDVQQELKDMVAQYPDARAARSRSRPRPSRAATSRPSRSPRNVDADDDTRPVVFLNGIHHAREWPATEVIMEFAWDLLKNHGTDAAAREDPPTTCASWCSRTRTSTASSCRAARRT